MKLFSQTSNPAMNKSIFNRISVAESSETMTIQGAVNKVGLMLLIVVLAASYTWSLAMKGSTLTMPLMIVGVIGGLITAIVTIFKKQYSAYTAPLYALFEGLFLGAISAMFAYLYEGVVFKAVILTFGVLFALLFAYKTGVIRATEKFKSGVIAATGGIFIFYMVTFVLRLFGVQLPMLHDGGIISILISLAIVVIAALNLVLDFDFIEQGAAANAPKYFEWYGAFGLMVTLIWLYLEILRLMSLLSGRD